MPLKTLSKKWTHQVNRANEVVFPGAVISIVPVKPAEKKSHISLHLIGKWGNLEGFVFTRLLRCLGSI